MPWNDSSKQIGQISLEGCLLNAVSIVILPWLPHLRRWHPHQTRVPRSKMWPWKAVETDVGVHSNGWCSWNVCVHTHWKKCMGHWGVDIISRNYWVCEMKLSGDIARHSAFGSLNLNSLQFQCKKNLKLKRSSQSAEILSFARLLLASCCCMLLCLIKQIPVSCLCWLLTPLHIGFLYKNAVLLWFHLGKHPCEEYERASKQSVARNMETINDET